jgi:hypothetical protein
MRAGVNGISRTGIVAVLVAAEFAIAAMAIYSLRGGRTIAFTIPARASYGAFAARPIAPILAGANPRVTIDDPNSFVEVSVSYDGLVHVSDSTRFSGGFFGADGRGYPQLTVNQDATGVHVSRPNYDIDWFSDATSYQHIEVKVPVGATVAIVNSGAASIVGLNGGSISAHADDGHIDLSDVTTPSLDITSNDGHIEARRVTLAGASARAKIHTDDGHVIVDGVFPPGGNYDISSNDGSVHVALRSGSDVSVEASTGDGSLTIDGQRQPGDDSSQQTVRVGGGAAAMQIHSDDGSVAITTNGAN